MSKALISAGVAFGAALLGSAVTASATVYTSDNNLADFTGSNYATFSDFTAGDVSSPFTPTTAGLLAVGNRVYSGTLTGTNLAPSNNYILASFSSAVSRIEIIPNIDHFGSQYDGYQYTIFGSNDGSTWNFLYDTISVAGVGEPFTIGTSSGTAPYLVNNVLTPSAFNPSGTPGYEAFFDFSGTGAFRYYALGASTVAFAQGNSDQEFSAVLASGVPEPSTWAMLLLGFAGLGFAGYRKAKVARTVLAA
jgi:hypothetical protein